GCVVPLDSYPGAEAALIGLLAPVRYFDQSGISWGVRDSTRRSFFPSVSAGGVGSASAGAAAGSAAGVALANSVLAGAAAAGSGCVSGGAAGSLAATSVTSAAS